MLQTNPDSQTKPATPKVDYSVREADFPSAGSPESKLKFLLNYAILAPSNRNSQPWRWRMCEDMALLYADRMRALPHLDPDDRELILSCGAALFHLRVAIRHFGYKAEVELLPERDNPNLLARVRLGDECDASPDDDLLFAAIPSRHTNRLPFQERELPPSLKKALQFQARQEDAWLLFVENIEARMAITNLIAKGDHVQGRDPLFLQETVSWIRPPQSLAGDGIPHEVLGEGGLRAHTADVGVAMGDKDQLLAWSAPALTVLETKDDRPLDWLAAGQALARVLLRASAEGVQASFMNSPVEVAGMWPELHHILGQAGLPQVILRLGYPVQETGPTPRRSVSEVTMDAI